MDNARSRQNIIRGLEDQAEVLTAHQLDLIAQTENHLRAVHHTMRRISTLRTARYRVGGELSNGERSDALSSLAEEITAIEAQLQVQHETCRDMQETVIRMQRAAEGLRQVADELQQADDGPKLDGGSSAQA